MKVIIIINKNSGAFVNSGNEFTKDRIKTVFRNLGIDNEIIPVNGNSISEIIRSKLSTNIDAVVSAGGDGTVSTAANALLGRNIPLAVLPAGTLNHFAKDLGIPLDLEKAAQVISNRKILKIDAGEVNEKIFINNSSIGIYPKVVKKRIENQRLGGSKWAAMGNAIIKIFKKFPLLEVNIDSEEEKISCKTPFVFVGNNKYKIDILNLGTREKLTEGYLSLYYPNSRNKNSIFRFAFLALINKLDQLKDFTILLTKEARLNIDSPKIEVTLDGEIYNFTPPLKYKIIPRCLNVIAP
jgi:diacylglycerol kinase family enzyme